MQNLDRFYIFLTSTTVLEEVIGEQEQHKEKKSGKIFSV